MHNLFKFLSKYHFFILFLILEITSLALAISSNRSKSKIIINSANSFAGYFSEKYNKISEYFHLKSENEKLLEENLRLRNFISSLNLDSSKKYQFNDISHKFQFQYTKAEVIKNSVYRQSNYITINKGKAEGILPDMGVISSNGIVGIVVDVSDHFASIISLLNTKVGISASVKKNNYFGTLIWDGDDYAKASLNEIPNHVAIDVGDTIVTSGFSTIFPQGIPIGIINEFKLKGTDNFYSINVQLFTDFKNLRHVYIIKNALRNEQIDIEKDDKNEY